MSARLPRCAPIIQRFWRMSAQLCAACKIRTCASRQASMMPEVVEVDGLPALKLHMYKQDTLTGEHKQSSTGQ
eukprot:1157619-Pelagomonas_calceolata.AAC.7